MKCFCGVVKKEEGTCVVTSVICSDFVLSETERGALLAAGCSCSVSSDIVSRIFEPDLSEG